MKELHTPTNELVDEYIKLFYKEKRYYLADKAIINLFEKFPENKNFEDILLKISVINDLYSTNIFATFIMAEHIQRLQIDDALRSADPNVVNQIAVGHGISKPKSTGDRNFYSFATKYCNWHNKNEYPIYDSYVNKILMAYQKRDHFSKFKGADLKDFKKFKSVIADFKREYSLTKHDLKDIDKFLWLYGQKNFPNNYRTSQKKNKKSALDHNS